MMTKFKVGDKVRLLSLEGALCGFKVGDKCEVKVVNNGGRYYYAISRGNCLGYVDGENIELIASHSPDSERITALESQVAELQAELQALKKRKKPKHLLNDLLAKHPTPNEQRKAIIKRAKEFIEVKTHYLKDSKYCKGGKSAKDRENPKFCDWVTKAEFIVNAEKRTVVAIIRNANGVKTVRAKGIAKCAPDDVFNADIGKAIALGRALGLDVSEFVNAPKPTEVVVGHKVRGNHRRVNYEVTAFHEDVKLNGEFGRAIAINGINSGAWVGTEQVTIIDDTEAQY